MTKSIIQVQTIPTVNVFRPGILHGVVNTQIGLRASLRKSEEHNCKLLMVILGLLSFAASAGVKEKSSFEVSF